MVDEKMFEVYSKEVTINTLMGDKVFTFYPLSGADYPKLLSVMKKFPDSAEGTDPVVANREFFEALDDITISNMHQLVFKTLVSSLGVTDEKQLKQLDMFSSQNLFPLFMAIGEVNFPKRSE